MGNCFISSSKIVSQNAKFKQRSHEADQWIINETKRIPSMSSKMEHLKHVQGGKAKMVRFSLSEEVNNVDEDGEVGDGTTSKGGGAVRIRVVVTKEELKQILSFRESINNSSVEQLISSLRLRERSWTDQVGSSDGGIMSTGSWKPVLGSIPEGARPWSSLE
ncbi:unnamed protein product [Dovyalis caffra]|uniref:Uncharacterized protein n=1 Tax=Dovyalis caffra TaxID=77055 RepID=A0AAV1SBY8_9ROSI|nr:unnamed protein product [Dovyalis caffra]